MGRGDGIPHHDVHTVPSARLSYVDSPLHHPPKKPDPSWTCQESNTERQVDGLWEEQLWEEHYRGNQTAEASASWGPFFFSPTKLGKCPPALECPHYKGKVMDIHPTTTTGSLSGMGKGA